MSSTVQRPVSCLVERSTGYNDLNLLATNRTAAAVATSTATATPTVATTTTSGGHHRRRVSSLTFAPSSQPSSATRAAPPEMETSPVVAAAPLPSSPGEGSPWIGGTGLGSTGLGKSGRVIERLMAENDRLRREMKAEIAKREELQRAAQTQKPRIESLQAENARLSNIKSMDDNIIRRRDRKIEELRAEVEVERQKRETLEKRAGDAERRREEHEEASNKEVQLAVEQAKHASLHANILETSHRQLAAEYRQRTTTMNRSLRELADDREETKKKVMKLEVVNQQMRHEAEKVRKLYGDLLAAVDRVHEQQQAHVDELDEGLRQVQRHDDERERDTRTGLRHLGETLDKMKWVMAVKKMTEEHKLESPPPSPC